VLELLRAAVAANCNVTYKARGNTPVDALLVEKAAATGMGGEKERYRRFLNIALARAGIGSFIKSDALVRRLAGVAGIKSVGMLHIKDEFKIGTQFCSKGTQVSRARALPPDGRVAQGD